MWDTEQYYLVEDNTSAFKNLSTMQLEHPQESKSVGYVCPLILCCIVGEGEN